MNDRTLFLADEIAVAFMDDFMLLPAEKLPFRENVYQGVSAAVARQSAFFLFTH